MPKLVKDEQRHKSNTVKSSDKNRIEKNTNSNLEVIKEDQIE